MVFLGVFTTILIGASSAWADALAPVERAILGRWQYSGFEYDGRRYANPNPKLVLFFEFRADAVVRLHWSRTGEPGFCEREAHYEIEAGDVLHQKVWRLHPGNDPACGQDPDMQLGRETENRIAISFGELRISMLLNGREFLYILSRTEDD